MNRNEIDSMWQRELKRHDAEERIEAYVPIPACDMVKARGRCFEIERVPEEGDAIEGFFGYCPNEGAIIETINISDVEHATEAEYLAWKASAPTIF
jgi:hypothetical protein